MNREAGCFEVALCLAHQVVGDDLLGRLGYGIVCDLRKVTGGDAKLVGIVGDIVSLAIMLGDERNEGIVEVDGAVADPLQTSPRGGFLHVNNL